MPSAGTRWNAALTPAIVWRCPLSVLVGSTPCGVGMNSESTPKGTVVLNAAPPVTAWRISPEKRVPSPRSNTSDAIVTRADSPGSDGSDALVTSSDAEPCFAWTSTP